jgi:hypothetical protein
MTTAAKIRQKELENPDDPNVRDPEHAHELGGTLGMTVGGVAGGIAAGAASAAAAGAVLGAAAGPVGVLAGAAIGGALGGAAGESIARSVNPTAEEKYWEENYKTRDYVTTDRDFETYRHAYRYGVDAYTRHEGRAFDEIEPQLKSEWEKSRGDSILDWDQARPATRDAYGRLYSSRK